MKSFIQGFAMVAFVFAASIAAEAQINYRADVDIPFEFNVGGKAYEAGKYTIKVNKQMVVGGAALMIQRIGTDEVQTILLTNRAGEGSGDTQLVFTSVDSRKYLTGINTATSEFGLVVDKGSKNRLAKSKTGGEGKNTEL